MDKQKINSLKRKQVFVTTRGNYKYGRVKQFRLSQNLRRPVRIVTKPKRYLTTSSENDSQVNKSKQKAIEKSVDLQKDIDEIHNTSFEEHDENAAPNIVGSQRTIESQNRVAEIVFEQQSLQQNESQNDRYKQLLSTPFTSFTLDEQQPESTNQSHSALTERVFKNNDSAVFNPLLHFRTLQQLPHSSESAERHSGITQLTSPQTCSATWATTELKMSPKCNSNSMQY
ncbi:uncharacterized protein LOC109860870 [Pseudomyrmex gracilis]|uniref:uncharacterized protein LOC109860870 n=1 Tax=Pseudomyrmex gracilis TaxID=219809 RepID=UPI00099588A7|nr:uncharacterized protein LOC109860870 [Pseudomyrmex gracilis]